MARDEKGRFKKVLGLECPQELKPSKYTERWRKKNPDLCSQCAERKKAPGLGRCAECAFGEEGAAQLRLPVPDLVAVMHPWAHRMDRDEKGRLKNGPNHVTALNKMFEAKYGKTRK